MPGVGIEDFGGTFTKYLPGYVNVLKRGNVLYTIPLGKVKWQGEKLLKKVEVATNTSFTNGVDGGMLPPAKKGTFVNSEGFRKFGYGSVALTDGVIANADSEENSCVKVTSYYLKGMFELSKNYGEFMISRDGTGIVSLLGATVSGATITVTDGRLLLPNKEYEIRNQTTGAVITSFEVQSVARAMTAGEATVSLKSTLAAAGQALGDYIVWGAGDYSAYQKAITGFDVLIDDAATTFQNVNVALYPYYSSPVIDGGGVTYSITPDIFRQLRATMRQEASNFDVPGGQLVYTSAWDGINVEKMFENQVRLTPDSKAVGLPGGMTIKDAQGTFTIMTAPKMQYGKMFFIDRQEISHPIQKELDWRRSEGGGIFERSDRFAGYTATCIEIGDLFIERRHTSGKLENLRVTPYSAY